MEYLKEFRKGRNLSQEKMAELLDVSLSLYTKIESDGSATAPVAADYYSTFTPTPVAADNYTGDCYTGMLPRYFMVVPSAWPYVKGTTETDIYVKIKYHVLTFDEKLDGKISKVENEITKKISVQLESGKSYNLKLVLGMTSVKLDAVVGEWQVGDDAEVNLPQNVE